MLWFRRFMLGLNCLVGGIHVVFGVVNAVTGDWWVVPLNVALVWLFQRNARDDLRALRTRCPICDKHCWAVDVVLGHCYVEHGVALQCGCPEMEPITNLAWDLWMNSQRVNRHYREAKHDLKEIYVRNMIGR